MKIIVSVLMLFIICIKLTYAEPEKIFVGLNFSHHELPEGCEIVGGMMINTKNDDLGVSHIKCHDKIYATLDRLLRRDAKGIPYWEVVDLAVLPSLHKGESVNEIDCTSPAGGYTVTVATWHNTKERIYADHISYALRLNLATSKFEVLNPNLVKCDQFDENEIRARQ
jgi:hypothetical protein